MIELISRESVVYDVREYGSYTVDEFINKFGDKPEYNKADVLAWLGAD